MMLAPLQSGSAGNSIFVATTDSNLLFDAGISANRIAKRLLVVGKTIADIDALFITHEHSDHIRYAHVLATKYQIPVFITPKTYERAKRRYRLDGISNLNFFEAGGSIQIGKTLVQSIPTPHDAVDACVFTVKDSYFKIGVFTDLGHVFPALADAVRTLDGIYIESNYDVMMLRKGPYPASLKKRIAGSGGHISNRDAAQLIATYASTRLQWICLGHLSEENNSPALALATHRQRLGAEIPIGIANRYDVGPIFQTSQKLFNPHAIREIAQPAQPAQAPVQLSLF